MFSERVAEGDFLLFNQQLVALMRTNLPLSEGLRMLSKEARKPATRRAVGELQQAIEAGQSLSRAVTERPNVFPKLYAKIIEAGEQSNNLVGILAQFVKHSETMAAMKQRLRDALMYPAFVLVCAVILATLMAFFVVPSMAHAAADVFGALHWEAGEESTRAKILMLMRRYVPAIGIALWAVVIGAGLAWLVLRATAAGRAVLDRIKLRLPVYGPCYQLSLVGRFSETLGILLQSGVPLADAVYLAGQCSPSPSIRSAGMRLQGAVEQGHTLSSAMGSEPILGPTLPFMVAIGERRDAPHEELVNAAELFGSNLLNRARRAVFWIEGIVLGLVTFLILVLAWVILQPLFTIIQTMGGY